MDKYTILIVEDEEDTRKSVLDTLQDEGYTVDAAKNGREALKLWQNRIYDLIVADLVMPEMGGREFINIVKEKQPYTQIIILSGKGEKGDLIDAIKHRVYDYLKKPVDLATLLHTVESAIEERDPLLIALENLAEQKQDAPQLIIGHETMSSTDIYNEVRRGSLFGKEYGREFRKNMTESRISKKSADDILGLKED